MNSFWCSCYCSNFCCYFTPCSLLNISLVLFGKENERRKSNVFKQSLRDSDSDSDSEFCSSHEFSMVNRISVNKLSYSDDNVFRRNNSHIRFGNLILLTNTFHFPWHWLCALFFHSIHFSRNWYKSFGINFQKPRRTEPNQAKPFRWMTCLHFQVQSSIHSYFHWIGLICCHW